MFLPCTQIFSFVWALAIIKKFVIHCEKGKKEIIIDRNFWYTFSTIIENIYTENVYFVLGNGKVLRLNGCFGI